MKTTIEYLCTRQFNDSFEVENVGNITLEAFNDDGLKWYFNINTTLGWCDIVTIGPIDTSTNLPYQYSFAYYKYRIEYNETKLYKAINNFANDTKKEITQINIIDHADLLEIIDNIKEKL